MAQTKFSTKITQLIINIYIYIQSQQSPERCRVCVDVGTKYNVDFCDLKAEPGSRGIISLILFYEVIGYRGLCLQDTGDDHVLIKAQ